MRQAGARAFLVAVVVGSLAVRPVCAEAQRAGDERPRWRTEARIDYFGSPDAAEAGLGRSLLVSTYLRLAAVAGVGTSWEGPDPAVASARIDLVGRYQLDPFFEHDWAPYIGGGGSLRFMSAAADDDEWRPFLLLALGVEGPLSRGWTPAAEIGLGGGVRLGFILRRGSAAGR